MKRFYAFLVVSLVFLLVVGCTPDGYSENDDGWNWRRSEFQGHTYIVRGAYKSSAIVHDPDCKCGKR